MDHVFDAGDDGDARGLRPCTACHATVPTGQSAEGCPGASLRVRVLVQGLGYNLGELAWFAPLEAKALVAYPSAVYAPEGFELETQTEREDREALELVAARA